MENQMTDKERAQQLWDTANEENSDFMLSMIFGEEDQAEQHRLAGIGACIELADLIRAGVDFFSTDTPEERQQFLDEYPAGSTAQGLVDAHFQND